VRKEREGTSLGNLTAEKTWEMAPGRIPFGKGGIRNKRAGLNTARGGFLADLPNNYPAWLEAVVESQKL